MRRRSMCVMQHEFIQQSLGNMENVPVTANVVRQEAFEWRETSLVTMISNLMRGIGMLAVVAAC